MIELNSEIWEDAVCKGEDINIFFPEPGRTYKENIQLAKSICASCPIAEQCIQYAISHGIKDGVWGGKTSNERAALRRTKYRSLPIAPKNK